MHLCLLGWKAVGVQNSTRRSAAHATRPSARRSPRKMDGGGNVPETRKSRPEPLLIEPEPRRIARRARAVALAWNEWSSGCAVARSKRR